MNRRRNAVRPTLRVLCAWCGAELRPGPQPVSYGICLPCRQAVLDGYVARHGPIGGATSTGSRFSPASSA